MDKKDTLKSVFQSSRCLSPQVARNYLDNKLSKQENFQVENHLLDCELCSDAVEGLETSDLVETEFDYEDFLLVLEKKEKRSAKVIEMPKRRFDVRKIAAAIAFLLMVGTSFYFWTNNNERLYSQFHKSYESDIFVTLRDDSSSNAIDNNLRLAFEKYEKKNYKESAVFFQKYIRQNPQNTEMVFYSGLAFLESEDSEKAIEYLSQVKSTNNFLFREATWYAALAYLKTGNEAKAKELTSELLQKKGRYYEEAKKLNSKL